MYMKRLDKTRDHGTCHPPENDAVYSQDGFFFDRDGKLVEALLTPAQKEYLEAKAAQRAARAVKPEGGGDKPKSSGEPKTKPAKPEAKTPAAQAADEIDDEQDFDGDGEPKKPADDEELNIEEWLRGAADHPFPAIKAAVKQRFNVWKTGKRALLEFLVDEQKIVSREALADDLKAILDGTAN